jgi:hypothetical protein
VILFPLILVSAFLMWLWEGLVNWWRKFLRDDTTVRRLRQQRPYVERAVGNIQAWYRRSKIPSPPKPLPPPTPEVDLLDLIVVEVVCATCIEILVRRANRNLDLADRYVANWHAARRELSRIGSMYS